MDEREEIYQKKTIDSAINIIMTKMDELRGANENDKSIMRRRWIWELIQNAKDCANGNEISIWIDINENELVFSHNGSIFTYSNLVDLITQISSKRINSEEMTGKFGTGFISTHLISEVVKVKGIYHNTPDSVNYKGMCLDIDRSGKNEQEIKESIINTISMLDTIDISDNIGFSFESSEANTSFIYDLTRKNTLEIQEAIKSGRYDLDRSIPLVFAFMNTIKEVHCEGVTYRRNSKTSLIKDRLDIIDVAITDADKNESIEIRKIIVCYDKTNEVSIATFIEMRDDRYYICPIVDIPKLFCVFPLIGTEDFSFPIVINSPNLKVLQERNHIQEGATTNKEIINIAISLYKELLEYVCRNNWNSLFNLCYIKHPKEPGFQKGIFDIIQSIYRIQPIVDVQHKTGEISKKALYEENNGKLTINILIPSMDKSEFNDRFWDLFNCLNTKEAIPMKDSYKYWLELSPYNKITLQKTYDSLLKNKTINDLYKWFTDKAEMMLWLNKVYSLWLDSSDKRNFIATAIVPNQDDQFIEITKVSVDDNIDDVLKEILSLLGTDIKKKLLHKNIRLPEGIGIDAFTNEYIANKINDHVRKQLSDESSNTTIRTQEVQTIFNKLTDWFLKNPDLAKPLFKDIYDKQYHQNILSSPEETARRLGLATTFENEMRANNLELEQIKIILKESGRLLKMFEDGEISISEDARQLFQHISSKSLYAKEKIDYLIERSIKSVYKELFDNPLYSVDNTLDEWKSNKYSTTVFRARKQDGQDIRVVIRPSDDDKIIFHEDAELEALDDTAYELWTDNEEGDVRIITLGDLLKTTGVSAIPLRKIF